MRLRWPETPVGWWRLALLVAAALFSLAIIFQPPPWKVFAEAGDKMRVVDCLIAYSWIAAAINIVLLAILAVLCPWWADSTRPERATGIAVRGLTPRWFWPSVLAAVFACSALAVPRLTQSLWDDEETSLRFYVLGRHKRSAEDGEVRLKEVRWRETLFLYDTPNNHIFYNTLARLSNSGWRSITRPEGLQFREWALRLPAFLAGLAALGVLAMLFKDVGLPLAGALASWLLALHPWFGKYCAEARGYTLAALLVCSAVFCWRRALLSGYWKWWALFALAQTLCLWTWPGALPFFMILNLGTLVAIIRGRNAALPRRTNLSRWFCVSALSGAALLQLMLPLVPQMKSYLTQAPPGGEAGKWLEDAGCYLAAGAPWSAAKDSSHGRAELRPAASANPTVFAAALVAGTLLILWGVLQILRRCGITGVVATTAVVGAAAIQIVQIACAHMFVFAWYLVYLLPFLVGALACGLAALVSWLRRMPIGRLAAPVSVFAVFTVFLVVTHPARARGLARSTEPVRESVLLTRPDLDHASERNAAIMTAGMTDPPFVYDPNIFWARSIRDLLLLCVQADAQNRTLWVNIGHTWLIRENAPRMQELLDDPAYFTDQAVLRSEFPHCDRTVMRYIPGSIGKADLSRFIQPADLEHIRENASITPEEYFAR